MATQPTVELNRRPEARASAHGVTELVVTGMTCSHCAQRVTGAIQSVAGVHSATVSLEARQALARWEPQARPDGKAWGCVYTFLHLRSSCGYLLTQFRSSFHWPAGAGQRPGYGRIPHSSG